MLQQKSSWPSQPTKKHLLLVTVVWALGIAAMTLAVTDCFTRSFFSRGYLLLYFLMLISTLVAGETFRNYFWPKKTTRQQK
ncbi:hypothetical protein [Rufibacter sp. LB8]|uniref:hypothetical protein n=1 Tax=Rufibacter sp. LB8 TaxID=2777781 RepID=UPI00178C6973|nr:hypothetical protein [Rufibacter sp. LB8]